VSLKPTTATSTLGYPKKYDSGVKYDAGLYYDRWYSLTGVISQGEKANLNVKEKSSIINVADNPPKLRIKNE
jgi:hypothetical protein